MAAVSATPTVAMNCVKSVGTKGTPVSRLVISRAVISYGIRHGRRQSGPDARI